MQKNLRVQVMQDLYAEIKKSRTGDLSRAIDFLKSAREIRQGKINKRKQVKINYTSYVFSGSLWELFIKIPH